MSQQRARSARRPARWWRRAIPARLGHDVRHAARRLARSPGFTIVAVFTLALGVGANSAIFSVVHRLLLAPPPYPAGDRLAVISTAVPGSGIRVMPTYAELTTWREAARSVDRVETVMAIDLAVAGDAAAEIVPGARVSVGFPSLLGARPILGRTFLPEDAAPGAAPVALIGEGYWRSRFGARPDVIGRTLLVSETPYTIVGVVPTAFDRALRGGARRELWLAYRAPSAGSPASQPGMTVVRLRPGATDAEAARELAAIDSAMVGRVVRRPIVERPQELLVHGARPTLLALAGAVTLVLLIACGNVANLLLVRGAARRREIAVRLALGASRGRIVGQLLVEGLLLATMAGVAAVLVAALALRVVVAVRPTNLELLDQVRLDGTTLAYALGVALATGLLCSLLPALRASTPARGGELAAGSATPAGVAGGRRFRSTLIVAEVAVSVVVLVSAGLLVRTMLRLREREPGYQPAGLLVATISPPRARYESEAARAALYRDVLAAARRLPGVAGATLVYEAPPSFAPEFGSLEVAGRTAPVDPDAVVPTNFLRPGALRVLGSRLIAGRDFQPAAGDAELHEVILGASTARRLWPDGEALGQRIRRGGWDGPWYTVVGIVADVAGSVSGGDDGRPQVYFPLDPAVGSATLALRVRGEPLAVVPSLTRMLHAIDPRLPLRDVATGEALARQTVTRQRFTMRLLLAFAALATLLAGIGLYGVIAYAVARRTREIGVRLAVGASAARVQRHVLLEGARLAGTGLAVGLVAAAAASRALAGLLYGVTPHDPATFAGVALVLGLVALVASWLPARRAARVDPLVALRAE
ncbi:MAG TPA: ABC transporter permease [Gemmatimonadaceae bacterium]|nr:ABC transporter permease [Gemmatimonadaceae bacterium]